MRGSEFRPTKPHRKKVEMLIACGMSEDDIARALGIATMTLRKHFTDELVHGRARYTANNLALLTKAAEGGNVAAQKYLDGRSTGTWAPKAESYVSKKIEQFQASKTAGHGSEWGDDLTPPPEAVN